MDRKADDAINLGSQKQKYKRQN